jgi:hypothetical protein
MLLLIRCLIKFLWYVCELEMGGLYIAHMGEIRNWSYTFKWKVRRECRLNNLRINWKVILTCILKCKIVDFWTRFILLKIRCQWLAFVNMAMNFQFPQKTANFLSNWAHLSFPKTATWGLSDVDVDITYCFFERPMAYIKHWPSAKWDGLILQSSLISTTPYSTHRR